MIQNIYATFLTEHDAERAAGALMDHGVSAQSISFVLSENVTHPTVFHPAETTEGEHPTDAATPVPRPLPGTYTPANVDIPPPPEFRNPLERQMMKLETPAILESARPGYHYDALG